MRIHHTQHQKAQKMGVQLEEAGHMIKAIWPARNMHVFGVDPRWAIEHMEAAQKLVRFAEENDAELSVVPSVANLSQVHLVLNGVQSDATNTPVMWWHGKDQITFGERVTPQPSEPPKVPMNGGNAYKLGFVAADCPYEENDPAFDSWHVEFDDAADKHEDPEDEEAAKPPASVVKQKYRALYAEAGHPTTCGDELAEKLNNLCRNSKGISIEQFDQIMAANEIDTSKYSRTSPGWQGRLRMTGRNLLAKKVHANGGVLRLPESWPEGPEMRMSAEWMALQRFK